MFSLTNFLAFIKMSLSSNRSIPAVFVLIIISLMFQSCENPIADFTMEPTDNPETFETISFFNQSVDAYTYEWKFGDGDNSLEENPTHVYDSPGTYEVMLTASDDKVSDDLTQLITISSATYLKIEIYRSNEVSALDNCLIWLYDNEDDWKQENRAQLYQYTTARGECFFLNLEDQVYYIRAYLYTDTGVWKASVATSELILNEPNLKKVYCDFYPYE